LHGGQGKACLLLAAKLHENFIVQYFIYRNSCVNNRLFSWYGVYTLKAMTAMTPMKEEKQNG
jgi:hypothetical protein